VLKWSSLLKRCFSCWFLLYLCWCHEHHSGNYSCSKMCSRMHQNATFRRRKYKFFSAEGDTPPQTSPPSALSAPPFECLRHPSPVIRPHFWIRAWPKLYAGLWLSAVWRGSKCTVLIFASQPYRCGRLDSFVDLPPTDNVVEFVASYYVAVSHRMLRLWMPNFANVLSRRITGLGLGLRLLSGLDYINAYSL